MHSDSQAQSFARDLLKPGFPFSIRDKNNKRMKIHRKINENQCVNLMPTLERAYNLCLEGKAEKALVTPSTQAIHPDKWLSPIKGKSVAPVIRELEAA